jgi:hypothetical protein
MKKLILAAFAAILLGSATLVPQAEARCWWNGYGWHCWYPHAWWWHRHYYHPHAWWWWHYHPYAWRYY